MTTSTYAATHYGTCQICGHEQKLPGQHLSLHGYTKRCGFFSGTCYGARELPFEQSIDLISGAIKSADETAKALRAEAKDRREMRDLNDVYMMVYLKNERGFSRGSSLVRGKIDVRDRDAVFQYELNGKACEENLGGYPSPQERVKELNRQHAIRLDTRAKQHEEYVAWQTKRIANWKPSELRPVAEQDRGTKKTLLHGYTDRFYRGGKYCASSAMGAMKGNWTKDWAKVTCEKCIKKHNVAIERAKQREKVC